MPIFTDPQAFPAFYELPSSSSPPPLPSSSAPPSSPPAAWFLLAQIKEDMTITKPTVIVRDRSETDFAVTFDDGDQHGLVISGGGAGGGRARFRKGHTLIVPCPARTDRGEGKKALVRVPEGLGKDVRVLPAGLERVFELGLLVRSGQGDGDQKKRACAACGKEGKCEGEDEDEGGQKLMRCTGCGVVAYCSKECQVRGWNDKGHKSDCKVLKGIKEIWP
ncbi:hypothetical protein F4781DRAFT_353352 [Annulohypoxylon bovei var. microspora]|nr:hypothetical protein F4781DRAFT_353352 [Annulohypoxylon bovei var. microspora]